LVALVESVSGDESLWAAVPRLFNTDGTPQDYYRRFPTLLTVLCDRIPPLRRLFRRAWDHHIYAGETFSVRSFVEAPPAACILLDRHEVGVELFDEQLSLFYNDTDLCLRMFNSGRRSVVVPSARAEHTRGASLAKERERNRYAVARLYDANCRAYARKHLKGWPIVAVVTSARRYAGLALGAATKT
jgi:GT2 family glycosyltransferase